MTGQDAGSPEGVQSMMWAVDLMEHRYTPARVKGGDAVLDDDE
ncbi:hypothetical protein ABZ770_40035 [Streptomyces sp. NPDC006654]